MVIARLHAQRQPLPGGIAGGLQQFRLQLFDKKVVRIALIHQQIGQARAAFNQGTGVIFRPSRAIIAQIAAQRFVAPWAVGG